MPQGSASRSVSPNNGGDLPWRIRATVTVPQAAQILSVSEATVRGMVLDGDLQGLQARGRQVVAVRSILSWVGEVRDVLRERKDAPVFSAESVRLAREIRNGG